MASLRRPEQAMAAAAIVLLVAALLPWYGGTTTPAISTTSQQSNVTPLSVGTTLSGWDAFTMQRWLWALTVVVAIAFVAITAAKRRLVAPVSPAAVVMALGAFCALCILFRCLYHPHRGIAGAALHESFGIQYGAWLGLAAALAIVVSARRILAQDAITMADVRDQVILALGGEPRARTTTTPPLPTLALPLQPTPAQAESPPAQAESPPAQAEPPAVLAPETRPAHTEAPPPPPAVSADHTPTQPQPPQPALPQRPEPPLPPGGMPPMVGD